MLPSLIKLEAGEKVASTKLAEKNNRIYEIPTGVSLETAIKDGTAKFVKRAKEPLPAMLFVQLWETSNTFEEFVSAAKERQDHYFTASSAKQRASKYRSKGIPLKKYPPKSRGIEPLDIGGLKAELERIRAAQAKS